MKVSDVMTVKVVSCKSETNLASVAALFWQNDCGSLPVVDQDGKLIGILTDRHVCIAIGTRDQRPSDLTAAEVMDETVVTCKPSDHVRSAVHLMRQAQVRRLPVLDENADLAGIISIDDILMNLQRDHGNVDALSYGEMLHSLQRIIAPAARPDSTRAAAA